MSRYAEQDVYRLLIDAGCEYEGDRHPTGTGWFAPDGMPFTLPSAEAGYMDADVIDRILSDRWIWRGPRTLPVYPD